MPRLDASLILMRDGSIQIRVSGRFLTVVEKRLHKKAFGALPAVKSCKPHDLCVYVWPEPGKLNEFNVSVVALARERFRIHRITSE